MTEPETIEGEVIEEVGRALEVAPARPPATLFHTENPAEVLARAAETATVLAGVLEQRQLFKVISGRRHVLVEGWTLLGSMLGVFPAEVTTHEIPDGWEAHVEVKTRDGATVGAADAMCTRRESTWKSRDDYALRSMAQTRAMSKAFRAPLGFIVQLAGYEATPAEEMPADEKRNEGGLGPATVPKNWTEINALVAKYAPEGGKEVWKALARAASNHLYGETDPKKMTKDQGKVMLQKAAGACVWLLENEDTPLGSSWSAEHMRKGWAAVLDGTVLETLDLPKRDEEAERIADEAFTGPPE